MIETTDKHLIDIEAEEAVLGALLLKPAKLELVESILSPEDFSCSAYATIFRTMRDLGAQGKPLDLLVIRSALDAAGLLAAVGGPAVLAALVEAVPSGVNAEHYARQVRERAHRRRVLAVADEMRTSIDMHQDATHVAQQAQRDLAAIESAGGRRLALIGEIPDDGAGARRITTGLRQLDEATGGGLPSTAVMTIAGATKAGKSWLALQVATHGEVHEPGQKRRPVRVALFSFEMSGLEIRDRLVAQIAKMDSRAVTALRTEHADEQAVARYGERYQAALECVRLLPLRVDTKPASALDVRAAIAEHRNDVDLVIVDHLQILSGTGGRQSEYERISEATATFKQTAQRFQIPIVMLSQLNRTNGDGPPTINSLRASGTIAQDSDVVALLHRNTAMEQPDDEFVTVEINVAANRHGPAFQQDLRLYPKWGRFHEL